MFAKHVTANKYQGKLITVLERTNKLKVQVNKSFASPRKLFPYEHTLRVLYEQVVNSEILAGVQSAMEQTLSDNILPLG